MTDLPPEPLVASDVDLRGMPWMPLETQRLLDSDLFALATAEEFRAAIVLWCKAWQQVPAGSLPSDERVLAHLSGAGARWPKLRAMALRGFVKCSDGRYYHPVIAEKVLEAWKERVRNREKQRAFRAKKGGGDGDVTVTQPGTKRLRDRDVTPDRDRDRDRDRDIEKLGGNINRGQCLTVGAAPPEKPQPPDPPQPPELPEAGRSPRGSRLPEGWAPSVELLAWAKAERPDLDLDRTLAQFADYWTAQAGQRARKANWDATWRNWVRREPRKSPSPAALPRQTSSREQRIAAYYAQAKAYHGERDVTAEVELLQ